MTNTATLRNTNHGGNTDPDLLVDRCGGCGRRGASNWLDYFCPTCGKHNDALYRQEHLSPQKARRMTRSQIQTEYRAAGIEFGRHRAMSAQEANLL